MVNYNEGKIYKIESTLGNMVYYGSTTKKRLCDRMTKHRGDYKCWLKGNAGLVMSYKLFEEYGLENCKIILVENCPCESKDELKARESYYIKNFECVNKNIPGRTDREYRADNKNKILERNKQYYEDNRNKIIEQKKQYYEDNKDKIAERDKQYYEDNRNKILEQKKQYHVDNKNKIAEQRKEHYEYNKNKILERNKKYRENNKNKTLERNKQYYEDNKNKILERMKIKYTCVCGSCICKGDKAKHERSKKHIKFLESQ